MLAREVDHRAKNALAIVHAIVCLTRADNIKQYVAAVEGRIQALARAHSLLAKSRWVGANIAQLVQDELAPYRTPKFDRIGISGSSLSLNATTAQGLALALHELATNAAKYGSLSTPAGGVQVAWEVKGGTLQLRWVEHGGPAVAHSGSGGFGIRVITASVETQLGGTVDPRLAPRGPAVRHIDPASVAVGISRSVAAAGAGRRRARASDRSKACGASASSWSRTRALSR